MKCYCYLLNVHDRLTDGRAAYETGFGVEFDGHVIAFGGKVSYKPVSSKDEPRLHQFGEMINSSILLHRTVAKGPLDEKTKNHFFEVERGKCLWSMSGKLHISPRRTSITIVRPG